MGKDLSRENYFFTGTCLYKVLILKAQKCKVFWNKDLVRSQFLVHNQLRACVTSLPTPANPQNFQIARQPSQIACSFILTSEVKFQASGFGLRALGF